METQRSVTGGRLEESGDMLSVAYAVPDLSGPACRRRADLSRVTAVVSYRHNGPIPLHRLLLEVGQRTSLMAPTSRLRWLRPSDGVRHRPPDTHDRRLRACLRARRSGVRGTQGAGTAARPGTPLPMVLQAFFAQAE